MGIRNLVHPPSSPDLHPTEFLWLIAKSIISAMKPKASSIEQLWEQVQVAWDDIDIETVNEVVATMEERRHAVLGLRTSYRF